MSNDLVPIPLTDLTTMATTMAKSGLFGVRTPDQALALMLVAQAEGRHPALAARDYNIINGRPAKNAEAMHRDFLQAGGKVEWHELTDTAVAATFTHPLGGSVRLDWDMNRAKRAGFGDKENYKKYPRQMLRSRVVSEGVRTVFPAATSGMYVPEEVRDMAPADTGNIPIIESVSDTTAELDQFAVSLAGDAVTDAPEVPGRQVPEAVTEEDPFGLPPLDPRAARRSTIWRDNSYHLKPPELLDGTPDWDKWAADIEYLIGEASSEEIDKLREDNKQLLQQLRRSERSDRYRDITIAAASRRADLHKEEAAS